MTEKAYITSRGMITFICPECQYSKVVQVDAHEGLATATSVRVTCRRCAHKFRVIIERRAHFRKAVNFAGSYRPAGHAERFPGGSMRVLDLSRTGLRIRLTEENRFEPGDRLLVEFYLDDAKRSLIRKEVEIKTVIGRDLGAAFCRMHPSDPSDRALGFYLLG